MNDLLKPKKSLPPKREMHLSVAAAVWLTPSTKPILEKNTCLLEDAMTALILK
ncbi:hypothetical protein AHAS_Ahas16G0269900 [Arachis hypogaea]